MKASLIVIIAALAAIIELSCKTETDVLFNQGGTYKQNVQSIFDRSCNMPACHGSSADSTGLLVLTSYGSVVAGGKYGHIIVPFHPEHSDLFAHCNIDTTIGEVAEPPMPPTSDSLYHFTQANRDTLHNWILRGCPADDGSIPYSTYPSGVVYVTNQAEDVVAVIDVSSNQVVRYVKSGVDVRLGPPLVPHNITVDSQGSSFYTTLVAGGTLLKFDCASLLKIGEVNVGTSPAHVVLNAKGDTAYVTNWDVTAKTERSVRVVNTTTMTVTDTIADQRMIAPHGERMSHDRHYLFTANQYSDNVTRINLFTKKVEAVIALAPDVPAFPPDGYAPKYQPFQVAMSLNDREVYVTCSATDEVRVIEVAADSMIKVIPVGKHPIQVRTSPNGMYVLVANRNDSSVSVINTTSNTVTKTILNVGAQPHGIEITADGRYAYVSCESQSGVATHHPLIGSFKPGTTAVIDMRTLELIPIDANGDTGIEMGSFPAGVAAAGRGD